MAEQIIPATNAAAKQQIVVLAGEAFVKDARGQLQPIKAGDTLLEGQIIATGATGHLTILLPNGQIIELGADRSLLIDGDLLATSPTDSTEAAIVSNSDSADQIINALNQGKDLSEELEATAAGLNAGAGTDEGNGFVRLMRIAENVDPLSFDFGTTQTEFEPLPELNNASTPIIIADAENQAPNFVDANNSPLGQSQTLATPEDTPISGQLKATDSDGDALVFNKVTDPSNGTVTVQTDGSWTYTPNKDYNGPDSFQVTVSDGKGGTDTLTVDIAVTPVNDAPDAQDDIASTLINTPVENIKVLINDKDVDGDTLIVTKAELTDPSKGSVTINADGSLNFTPATNVLGPVVINYTISDGKGGTDIAQLTVNVGDVATPPIAKIEVGQPGPQDDSVVEGNNLVFNVTLTSASPKSESYAFSLGGGSASAADYGTPTFSNGVTFNPVTGQITVPAGVTSFAVTLPTVDDTIIENAETVPLTIGGVTATGTITDNDSQTITTIEPGAVGPAGDSVVEGNALVYNVTLSGASPNPTTYAFSLGGTAAGNASTADYGTPTFSNGVTFNPVTGQITVPAGVTSFAVTLPTVDDTIIENAETVPLTIGGVTATGTITDNDSQTITTIEPGAVGPAGDSVVEGNALVYNVTLSGASPNPTTYAFSLGGTAAGNASTADYGTPTFSNGVTFNPVTGQITVPAGVTSFAVTLPTVDDTIIENAETVPLTIGGVTATGTITDNDSQTITTIEPGAVGPAGDSVVEGNALVYNVTLSGASPNPTTYAFSLGGTAAGNASTADYGTPTFSNGVTFNPVTGQITVPAGVTSFAVTLPTVDDTIIENAETVPLTIGGVTATGTITDNDSQTITTIEPGAVGPAGDSVVEGNALVYNVTLSGASPNPTTYAFSLGGTAAGNASTADYGTPTFSNGVTFNPVTGQITVPAGVTSFAVTLPTVDDTIIENAETVPLTIGGVTATGTITDNDSQTITTIEPGAVGPAGDSVVEGNALVYNVTLSGASPNPTTYAFSLGGTAAGNASTADYGTPTFSNGVTFNPVTGQITVPAGVTSFAVTLPTVDDTIIENAETVPLTIGGVTATGTITDNDSQTITTIEPGAVGPAGDSVVEGNALVYNVTLSGASPNPTTYAFSLGGTAAGNASTADYGTPTFSNGVTFNPVTGQITVPAGVTSFAVTLPTVDDTIIENAETVPLTIGGVTATGTITDNDSQTITTIEPGAVGPAGDSVVEGNALVYNVTLSGASPNPTTYAFSLGGTAAGNASTADYGTPTFSNGVTFNPVTGQITVPAGVTSFAVTLPTVDDTIIENAETVPLTIGGVTATGTITDNDSQTITTIEPGAVGPAGDSVVEGNALVYNVTLSGASPNPTTYAFSLGGTAAGNASTADYGTPTFSNGVTFNPVTGQITVPAGVTSFAVTLPTVDDTIIENAETVPLTIGGVTATGTITDNDSQTITTIEPGAVGPAGDSVVEGNALVYNVTLSGASPNPTTYAFSLGGTAAGNASTADYGTPTFSNGVTFNPVTGQITVPAGVTSFAVTLPTVDDTIIENAETVPLTIGGVTATGTITDNDSQTITTIEPGAVGPAGDSVVEGNALVYNVTLSGASPNPTTYAFSLGGTAAGNASTADYGTPTFSNGVTFNPVTGQITVPAGVTSFAVTLPTVDDTIIENAETVPLTIGGVTATGTITDNDSQTITTIEPGAVGPAGDSVVEGNALVYNVTLSGASPNPTTYAFSLGGTAAGNASTADYGTPTFSNGVTFNPVTGQITVPAGVTSFAVTLPTVDDTIIENAETVPLTIGGVTATGTITDNDSQTITTIEPGAVGPAGDSVVEGNALVYNVTLSGASPNPTTYAFSLGGTAAGNASTADYGTPTFSNGVTFNPVTGQITVPAGVTSFAVTLPTVDDTIIENAETVPLTIGGVTATGTITDNDSQTITTIEPGAVGPAGDSVVEGNALVYNVTLSGASPNPTTYAFSLGGTAAGNASTADYGTPTFSNGVTFNPVTGQITVPAGVTSFAVTLPTVDDTIIENAETVPLTIGGVTATGTITDNDSQTITTIEPGAVGPAGDSVVEGNALVYNVTLSGASPNPTTYAFSLGGTAAGNASTADYGTPTFSNGVTFNPVTGQITVPAGVTSFAVTLPTVDDTIIENAETVPLTIGGVTATGTITDNDSQTITTIEPGAVGPAGDSVVEGNALVYNVTLSGASPNPTTYAFSLGGTAAGNASTADYGTPTFSNGVTFNPVTGQITVPAGVTSFAVTLPTVDDTIIENAETVPLTIGGVTATGTITDNDSQTITTIEPGAVGPAGDSVVEGNALVYNVTLSGASPNPTTYAFSLGGTAAGNASTADYGTPTFSNGVTFNPVTGQITVPAGVTSFAVTLPTVDDTIIENAETVPLTIGGVTATGTITDNDSQTITTIEPGAVGPAGDSVVEGNALVYNVTLSGASPNPTTYAFSLGGTAAGNASTADYGTPTFSNGVTFNPVTGQITVPAGVTSFAVTLPTVDDTIIENAETVPLTIGGVTATGTITDNDSQTITTIEPGAVGPAGDSVVEGNALVYNVTLSGASPNPTTYAFSLGGTAAGNASTADYGTPTFSNGVTFNPVTGQITVPAGVTSFAVTLPTVDDTIIENAETVPLTIGGVTATGTITDNDSQTITTIEPGAVGPAGDSVVEGNALVYNVTLSGASPNPTTYAFSLGGTAAGNASTADYGTPTFSNGVTFNPVTGQITVPAGVTSFAVTLPTVDDTIIENAETVPLTIGGVTATGTITDNDSQTITTIEPGAVGPAGDSVVEGNALVYNVTLSGASPNPTTYAFSLGGTAAGNASTADYGTPTFSNGVTFNPVTGQITVPAGVTSFAVTLPTVDDTIIENAETVPLTIGGVTATGTITDNDSQTITTIEPGAVGPAGDSVVEGNALVYNVTLSGASPNPTTYAFSLGGTAAGNASTADYGTPTFSNGVTFNPVTGQITVPAGVTSFAVTLPTVDDTIIENAETVPLTIGGVTATGTITDNDSQTITTIEPGAVGPAGDSVVEGNALVYNVTLSGASPNPTTYAFSLGGTAAGNASTADYGTPTFSNGVTFNPVTGQITVPAGVTSFAVTLPTVDDTIIENAETVPLTIGGVTATGTITDNDSQTITTIEPGAVGPAGDSVVEGNALVYNVTLSGASPNPTTYAFSLGGTAAGNASTADYGTPTFSNGVTFNPVTGQITVPAGVTSFAVTLPTVDDTIIENAETVPLTIGGVTATGTITDNDSQTITTIEPGAVGPAGDSVVEGNALVYNVTLSGASPNPTTYAFSLGGTAAGNASTADYGTPTFSNGVTFNPVTGQITVPAGVTSFAVTLPTVDDTIIENAETVPLTIGGVTATGTITDNDSQTITTIEPGAVGPAGDSVVEGNALVYNVTLSGASPNPTTYAFSLGGTAAGNASTADYGTPTFSNGVTFNPVTGQITVPAGVTSFAVTLPTVDDTIIENAETVPLTIGGVTATGTITDNDSQTITTIEPGAVGPAGDSVVEGNALVYNVTLSGASPNPTTYAFSLGGTAAGNASTADYGTPTFSNGVTFNPVTGQITVPAGVTSFAVTLPTVDDTIIENAETVPLTIGGVTATGTITDNDSQTITTIEPGAVGPAGDSVVEGNALVYNVTLSGASPNPTTYAFSLGGTAAGNASTADYGTPTFSNGVTFNPVTGQITVPAGVTSFAVTLPTVDDTIIENAETVPLTIGGVTATGTITDNDSQTITTIEPGAVGPAGDSVVEGNALVYNVTLSGASPNPTTYAFSLGGTAAGNASTADYGTPTFSNGVTFNPVTGQITVPAGVTSFAVTLPTVDDTIIENAETVPLTIGGVTATGTITDNDSQTITTIEPGAVGPAGDSVVEGNALVYNVTLSGASPNPTTYAFSLGGTAAGNASTADYGTPTFSNGVTFNPVTGQITVPAGVTSFAVTLPTVDDTIIENAETVPLTIGGVTATGTITDNDSQTITTIEPGAVGPAGDSVVEGNALVYNVTLSGASPNPTTYAFSLGGTAAGNASTADYGTPTFSNGVTFNPVTGQITVPAGVTSFAVTLPTVDDTIIENAETVPLTIGGVTATGTITDNDSQTITTIEPGAVGPAGDSVVEGNALVYNVTLSGASPNPTTYAFSLGGTAAGNASTADYGTPTFSNGVTFNPVTGQITVPAGVTSFAVTLPTVDDTIIENAETVPLTIGGVTATGTITDNDSQTITTIEPGAVGPAGDSVVEGNALVYNVTLSGASPNPTTYAFSLGGTAAGNASTADYGTPTFSNGVTFNPVTGQITVPAGVTSFAVTLPTVDDTIIENAETVPLTIGGVTATGTITDNDSQTITTIEPGAVGPAGDSVVEGNALVYNVTLSGASPNPTTYAFSLGGTAAGNASTADYGTPTFSNGVTFNPVTGQITVPAGVTSFAVTLPTVDDTIIENAETVPLTIGGVTATGTITDNDSQTITTIEPGAVGPAGDSVVEGNALVYNVTLSGASPNPTTYAFSLGGTAAGNASTADYGTPTFSNGVTFNPVTGQITVPAGVTSFAVTLPTVDDTIIENAETVPLTIGGVTATGTITDNDSQTITTIEPGAVGPAGDSVVEGNALVYNVTLSGASPNPTTYAFSLGGTAAGNASTADYGTPTFSNGVTFNPVTGQITVPAGVTSFAVTLPTVDDTIIENAETVPLTIGGVTATGTITDNDSQTITTIEPGAVGPAGDSVVEGNALVYNVTLSGASPNPTTYAFSLGGTAAGNASTADYGTPTFSNGVTFNPVTGQITVPAGVTSFAVTLPTVDDTIIENAETVPLTIGGVTAIGTILDNDASPTSTGAR
ncbi:retention module-containing protein [Deefgea tanakiae]|uniref:Retention module-containing protein n=1 Tax=Deefgea tanakiae TaxID=2865840 RepID=A0ABX8Z5A9_9NEIS|nr:retention module-containing protein [Deefgea tanakiae]QZA77772.1 retention module-containing protein [Deefgea tanakiae]